MCVVGNVHLKRNVEGKEKMEDVYKHKIKVLEETLADCSTRYQVILFKKDKQIAELKKEIERLEYVIKKNKPTQLSG